MVCIVLGYFMCAKIDLGTSIPASGPLDRKGEYGMDTGLDC